MGNLTTVLPLPSTLDPKYQNDTRGYYLSELEKTIKQERPKWCVPVNQSPPLNQKQKWLQESAVFLNSILFDMARLDNMKIRNEAAKILKINPEEELTEFRTAFKRAVLRKLLDLWKSDMQQRRIKKEGIPFSVLLIFHQMEAIQLNDDRIILDLAKLNNEEAGQFLLNAITGYLNWIQTGELPNESNIPGRFPFFQPLSISQLETAKKIATRLKASLSPDTLPEEQTKMMMLGAAALDRDITSPDVEKNLEDMIHALENLISPPKEDGLQPNAGNSLGDYLGGSSTMVLALSGAAIVGASVLFGFFARR
eukprot:TRINITY_DN14016_c0_g1_i1.p1 TRINITY_DN14016_c0_g1~~TRINITY_DN14016_c0_g1_i1.p1  ORF type:complete len:356 (-),score=97.12 TRINITY_DN14016_c0_g1_i1:36-965(-)